MIPVEQQSVTTGATGTEPSALLKHAPQHCPYCRDRVEQTEDQVVCQRCLARHHPDCWSTSNRCAVHGCSGETALARPAQASVAMAKSSAPAGAGTSLQTMSNIDVCYLDHLHAIRMDQRGMGWSTFVAVLSIAVFLNTAFDYSDYWPLQIAHWLWALGAAFLAFHYGSDTRRLAADRESRRKRLVTGVIEARSTVATLAFYFFVDGQKYAVPQGTYQRFLEGDRVTLHLGSVSKTVLCVEPAPADAIPA